MRCALFSGYIFVSDKTIKAMKAINITGGKGEVGYRIENMPHSTHIYTAAEHKGVRLNEMILGQGQ